MSPKRAIGATRLLLSITEDDSIIIASGTTMASLAGDQARRPPDGHHGGGSVTQILSQHADVDVIRIGGITRNSSVFPWWGPSRVDAAGF